MHLNLPPQQKTDEEVKQGHAADDLPEGGGGRRRLMGVDEEDGSAENGKLKAGDEGEFSSMEAGGASNKKGGAAGVEGNPQGGLSKEADASMDVFDDEDGKGDLNSSDYGKDWDR